MGKIDVTLVRDQDVFVGIDVSKRSYAVAVRGSNRVIHYCTFPARYEHLCALWSQLPGCRIHAVYEAGFLGFGLHDQLRADGIDACVTPPSKFPRSPDRVKTDRLDAQTLARELDLRGFFAPLPGPLPAGASGARMVALPDPTDDAASAPEESDQDAIGLARAPAFSGRTTTLEQGLPGPSAQIGA